MTLSAALLVIPATTAGSEPVAMADEIDREILEAFLGHVRSSARHCTPERMAKFASQPEDITWQALPYISMPLIAYRLIGDAEYLDMFAERMDNLCDQLKPGSDGYMGWYGLPLDLFRHPDHPDQQVDVILTSFAVAGMMADFARVIHDDESLKDGYGDAVQRYLTLAEDHLIEKWDARGCYKDLGEKGAVYITHPDLKPVKGSLTQPHNKHSKIIRSLLSMYAATGKDEYLVKAVKLGTRYKHCLTLVDDHYEWHYWDPAGEWDVDPENPRKWKHWIGAEHRSGYYSSTLSQAVILYEHGLVFDKTDMDRFVKTQMEVCWNGDLNDPKWARVDGKASENAYLCSSLAPFQESVYQMAYGASAQRGRLERKNHSWQGGATASGWFEFKYLTYPRWKNGEPAEKDVVARFLEQEEGQSLMEELVLEVEAPGYQAPTNPEQMR